MSRTDPDEGRFGGLFGSVVHQAIGAVLRKSALTPEEAVQQAAASYGLAEHLEEAVADVGRALKALRGQKLARPPGADLQLEYPIAGPWEGGQLMSGYIDLVAVEDGRAHIVDFKTDAPPHGPVEQAYPDYIAQVRAYARLLELAGVLEGIHNRCGLLFTADGVIRRVEP